MSETKKIYKVEILLHFMPAVRLINFAVAEASTNPSGDFLHRMTFSFADLRDGCRCLVAWAKLGIEENGRFTRADKDSLKQAYEAMMVECKWRCVKYLADRGRLVFP